MNNPSGERGDARMTHHRPVYHRQSPEVMTRNSTARHIVAGFGRPRPRSRPCGSRSTPRSPTPATWPPRSPGCRPDCGPAAGPGEPARRDARHTRRSSRRGTRPALLPARRTASLADAARPAQGAAMADNPRYRQMRRHARQARRADMQPMMVINSGDPFPDLAIVVIARWAWRYRSELAPGSRRGRADRRRRMGPCRASRSGSTHTGGQSGRRVASDGVRRANRPRAASRARLRQRGDPRGRSVAGPGRRARPARPAAAAGPGHRRGAAVGAVVGTPAPPRQGPRRAHPGRLARHRPRGRAWPALRSCPPRWTCGAGGHGSAWHAARPSPM